MRQYLIAGNWKMNTERAGACALAEAVATGSEPHVAVEVAIAPPFPYLDPVADVLQGSRVALAAQNVWHEPPGAFTGETSVGMLQDLGCRYVILGHSERRHVLGEDDALIARKINAALAGGLDVIFCIGEQLTEREDDRTEEVLQRQLAGGLADVDQQAMRRIVVAYEPVWAIGTGKVATPEQAQSAHAFIRRWLADRYTAELAEQIRIQYGGSVKLDNAQSLLEQPDVDGALVGGASLKAESFLPIVEAATALSS